MSFQGSINQALGAIGAAATASALSDKFKQEKIQSAYNNLSSSKQEVVNNVAEVTGGGKYNKQLIENVSKMDDKEVYQHMAEAKLYKELEGQEVNKYYKQLFNELNGNDKKYRDEKKANAANNRAGMQAEDAKKQEERTKHLHSLFQGDYYRGKK